MRALGSSGAMGEQGGGTDPVTTSNVSCPGEKGEEKDPSYLDQSNANGLD